LQQFFPERHYLPLLEILATVTPYGQFSIDLGRPSFLEAA
jgi:hypothetical protein